MDDLTLTPFFKRGSEMDFVLKVVEESQCQLTASLGRAVQSVKGSKKMNKKKIYNGRLLPVCCGANNILIKIFRNGTMETPGNLHHLLPEGPAVITNG